MLASWMCADRGQDECRWLGGGGPWEKCARAFLQGLTGKIRENGKTEILNVGAVGTQLFGRTMGDERDLQAMFCLSIVESGPARVDCLDQKRCSRREQQASDMSST